MRTRVYILTPHAGSPLKETRGHGHGHGHVLFILATYHEGKWTTHPNPLSPIPAQAQQRALVRMTVTVTEYLF